MQPTLKFGFSVLLLILSLNLISQDFELFKMETSYYSKQTIEDSSTDGEIGFFEWSGVLAIPQPLKNKKTLFIHKLGYSNLKVDTEVDLNNTSFKSTKHYHTISYNLGLVQTISPTWRLLLNINPTAASDFSEALSDDDLLIQTSILLIKAKSREFKYGFGLAYTTRFGRQIIIPTGLIQYKTDRVFLDILLPSKLSLKFNTNKVFNYGFEANLGGGLFNNNSDVQFLNTLIDEAGYSRLNLGPTLSFKVKSTINIFLTGGMVVGRKLEFIDITEDVLDSTPASGPFFRVGISFNPQRKNIKASSSN